MADNEWIRDLIMYRELRGIREGAQGTQPAPTGAAAHRDWHTHAGIGHAHDGAQAMHFHPGGRSDTFLAGNRRTGHARDTSGWWRAKPITVAVHVDWHHGDVPLAVTDLTAPVAPTEEALLHPPLVLTPRGISAVEGRQWQMYSRRMLDNAAHWGPGGRPDVVVAARAAELLEWNRSVLLFTIYNTFQFRRDGIAAAAPAALGSTSRAAVDAYAAEIEHFDTHLDGALDAPAALRHAAERTGSVDDPAYAAYEFCAALVTDADLPRRLLHGSATPEILERAAAHWPQAVHADLLAALERCASELTGATATTPSPGPQRAPTAGWVGAVSRTDPNFLDNPGRSAYDWPDRPGPGLPLSRTAVEVLYKLLETVGDPRWSDYLRAVDDRTDLFAPHPNLAAIDTTLLQTDAVATTLLIAGARTALARNPQWATHPTFADRSVDDVLADFAAAERWFDGIAPDLDGSVAELGRLRQRASRTLDEIAGILDLLAHPDPRRVPPPERFADELTDPPAGGRCSTSPEAQHAVADALGTIRDAYTSTGRDDLAAVVDSLTRDWRHADPADLPAEVATAVAVLLHAADLPWVNVDVAGTDLTAQINGIAAPATLDVAAVRADYLATYLR